MDLKGLQKTIYLNVKNRAQRIEGELSIELLRYRKDFENASKRDFSKSSIDSLLAKLTESQVIYIGDFHTFDQSPRNFERILRHLNEDDAPLVIGLELLKIKDQSFVQSYLGGFITEMELLDCINYSQSWRFPWNHYKPIFQFAKEHQIKIIGLNSSGPISDRDRRASEVITGEINLYPNSSIMVLFGEYHLVADKLPGMVKKQMPALNQTIIFQNLDDVYWKLEDTDSQDSHIVSFNPNEFALQSSPPWVKYESMIYWYENLMDDPEFDIHEYIIETGHKVFAESTVDHFYQIIVNLGLALDVPINKDKAENFNLHDHTRLDYVQEVINKIENQEIKDFYQYILTQNELFKLPYSNNYYCPNYSVNRLSYLAGIHFFNVVNEGLEHFDQQVASESLKRGSLLLPMLFGQLSSKIINPHRKCDLFLDFIEKSKLENDDSHIYKVVIQILENKDLNYMPEDLVQAFKVSKILAHYFAEHIFNSLDNHQFSQVTIYYQLLNGALTSDYFTKLCNFLFPNDDFKKVKKRFF